MLLLKFRPRTYPYRRETNVVRGNGKIVLTDDRGGDGWEVQKEVPVCNECFRDAAVEAPFVEKRPYRQPRWYWKLKALRSGVTHEDEEGDEQLD